MNGMSSHPDYSPGSLLQDDISDLIKCLVVLGRSYLLTWENLTCGISPGPSANKTTLIVDCCMSVEHRVVTFLFIWLSKPAADAKSLQSCPTPCDPIDSSPPGSPVPGILQARTLEWVAISFSNAWKCSRSVVSDLTTPWTAAYQAPPSMGFSRQEYWSGVPLPSPLSKPTVYLLFF